MRLFDIIQTSQRNLFRAKLRTFLTVAAIFIGALTLSLTNGVGNGIKAYVNDQLGNVGAENTLIITAKQTASNPISSNIQPYNPDRTNGGPFNITLINEKDLETLRGVSGIQTVTPQYNPQLEYIGTDTKYEATIQQHIAGLNLQMDAGRAVSPDSVDEITLPARYIQKGIAQDAVGKFVVIGYKNATGELIEKNVRIVGVQSQSLLGNTSISAGPLLAKEIHDQQTSGAANPVGTYQSGIAQYDPNLTETQVTELKNRLKELGYDAQTFQDQVGTIGKVINSILIVLNIFAVITLLAAAFGIVNTLLMSVKERTSEIGLMKALGANRKTVFTIFALEAASIGFWGALLGVGVSIGLGTVANNLASQTILKDFVGFDLLTFPLLPTLGVLAGIMALSFVAGTLPSLRASKLDPIKALRYE
ncbi:MAG: ABC transporter permease [Candidatus Doudnabacteria bacterium]|nr:ABC transporter permease [Candidatus Doudnabacteria bacterium]